MPWSTTSRDEVAGAGLRRRCRDREGRGCRPARRCSVTVKVNIDQKGFATTNGLKLNREAIAATNSPVIDNL
jgi:hypothetical protein